MLSTNLPAILPSLFPAIVINGHWRPGISDPTPMGWIIFLCYFVGSVLCVRRAWKCFQVPALRGKPLAFWVMVGIVMYLLCMNKQLDLHQLITQIGRDWARADGWFENRRAVQLVFIKGLALAATVTLIIAIWALRDMPRRYHLAFVGLVLLGSYVFLRAASFHHADTFLGLGTDGFRLAWVVELGGIFITSAAALIPDRVAIKSDGVAQRDKAQPPKTK